MKIFLKKLLGTIGVLCSVYLALLPIAAAWLRDYTWAETLGLFAICGPWAILAFIGSLRLFRPPPAAQEPSEGTPSEIPGVEAAPRSNPLSLVGRHYKSISFVLLVIVIPNVLNSLSDWTPESDEPIPFHFSVLVYYPGTDALRTLGYSRVQDLMKDPEAEAFTFLLPDNAEQDYRVEELDTTFSIRRESPEEQTITVNYEVALFSYGTSRYKATANGIEPLKASQGTSIVFTFGLLGWIGLITIIGTIRVIAKSLSPDDN